MKDPISTTLVSFPQLREQFGILFRRQSILRLRRRGRFAEPLRLSEKTVAWRVSDIEEWLASRPRAEQQPPPSTKSKTKNRRAAPVRRRIATRKMHGASEIHTDR